MTRLTRLTGSKTEPVGPRVSFDYRTARSQKVRCMVCGANGYGPATDKPYEMDWTELNPWQRTCMLGHQQCRKCGRWMKLKLDGTATSHTRCPNADEAPAHS